MNWKKYKLKVSIERQNQYLDYLIDPSFQFPSFLVWSFEYNTGRTGYTGYFPEKVATKDYNVRTKLIWSISWKWFKNIP